MEYEYISIDDEQYPDKLKSIVDPPKGLYCIGDVALLKTKAFAVVGTRRSSPYGRWAAREIGASIASCGVTVVSGLAEGIDSEGHRGCLESFGKTIAVLGTAIDVCFPKSNQKLFDRIAEEGLIVSEYGPDDETGNWAFPRRNRIISGLSEGVIVVEGALRSGSMITANLAVEQSRNLFAVPGNINQPNSVGVNSLIRDGAVPVLSVRDLPETLGITADRYNYRMGQCTLEEAKVLECVRFFDGIDQSVISSNCNLEIIETIKILTRLELRGWVLREGSCVYYQ